MASVNVLASGVVYFLVLVEDHLAPEHLSVLRPTICPSLATHLATRINLSFIIHDRSAQGGSVDVLIGSNAESCKLYQARG